MEGGDPPKRKQELLTAAKVCLRAVTGTARDGFNYIVASTLGGSRGAVRRTRRELFQRREDELAEEKAEAERAEAEENERLAALPIEAARVEARRKEAEFEEATKKRIAARDAKKARNPCVGFQVTCSLPASPGCCHCRKTGTPAASPTPTDPALRKPQRDIETAGTWILYSSCI